MLYGLNLKIKIAESRYQQTIEYIMIDFIVGHARMYLHLPKSIFNFIL